MEASPQLTNIHGAKGCFAYAQMRDLVINITLKLQPAPNIYWCNSGTNVMEVTNYLLIEFKAQSMRPHT